MKNNRILLALLFCCCLAVKVLGQYGSGTGSYGSVGQGGGALFASQFGTPFITSFANETGADGTAFLQSLLNKATNGASAEVVLDGKALLTTNLIIHSNTRFRILPGGGMLLKSNTCCPMMITDVNTNFAATNIVIEGGIWWNNGTNSSRMIGDVARSHGDVPSGASWSNFVNNTIWISGASNVLLQNIQVVNPATWGIVISDSKQVTVEKCRITDYWNGTPNSDGFHFSGGLSDLVYRDCYYKGNSDGFAINMGETASWTFPQAAPFFTQRSTISNLLVESCISEKGGATSFMDAVRVGYPAFQGTYRQITFKNFKAVGNIQGLFNGVFENVDRLVIDGLIVDPNGGSYPDLSTAGTVADTGISFDSAGTVIINNVHAKLHASTPMGPFIMAGSAGGSNGSNAGATNVILSNIELEWDGYGGTGGTNCNVYDPAGSGVNQGAGASTNTCVNMQNIHQTLGGAVLADALGGGSPTRINVANVYSKGGLLLPAAASLTNIWRATTTNYLHGFAQ